MLEICLLGVLVPKARRIIAYEAVRVEQKTLAGTLVVTS